MGGYGSFYFIFYRHGSTQSVHTSELLSTRATVSRNADICITTYLFVPSDNGNLSSFTIHTCYMHTYACITVYSTYPNPFFPSKPRVENLKRFKSNDGDCPTLVCTDLAARGLDLDVDHVIMFDFPLNSVSIISLVSWVFCWFPPSPLSLSLSLTNFFFFLSFRHEVV